MRSRRTRTAWRSLPTAPARPAPRRRRSRRRWKWSISSAARPRSSRRGTRPRSPDGARAMPITDRYGLPLTTSSAVAADRFQDGMDRLLAYGPGVEQAFSSALQADDALAVAHAGLALVAVANGDA